MHTTPHPISASRTVTAASERASLAHTHLLRQRGVLLRNKLLHTLFIERRRRCGGELALQRRNRLFQALRTDNASTQKTCARGAFVSARSSRARITRPLA